MFDAQQYQLLDFGDGRKLERFGALVLDRPCPAAEAVSRGRPQIWPSADARFERVQPSDGSGEPDQWIMRGELPPCWTIAHGPLVFELKRTDFGHVGLFPEQAENWDWTAQQIARCQANLSRPVKVLNLFAYTGGSTLAAAVAGAEVTHVDAARNIVAWARRNAELSGLRNAPIRWIAEDAMKFVSRELRRGNCYDALILDPPSYGHGTRGQTWQLDKHLPELLAICAELTAPAPQFMLLTCHSPGYTAERLRNSLAVCFPPSFAQGCEARELLLRASTGQALPSGVVVRG